MPVEACVVRARLPIGRGRHVYSSLAVGKHVMPFWCLRQIRFYHDAPLRSCSLAHMRPAHRRPHTSRRPPARTEMAAPGRAQKPLRPDTEAPGRPLLPAGTYGTCAPGRGPFRPRGRRYGCGGACPYVGGDGVIPLPLRAFGHCDLLKPRRRAGFDKSAARTSSLAASLAG